MRVRLTTAALALALAGCGDGADGEDGGEPPPTATAEQQVGSSKPELIARADAICGQSKINIDMARTKFHHGNFDQASTPELKKFVAERIVPVYENELASLEKLAAEGAGDDDLEQVVASGRSATAKLASDPLKVSAVGGSALFDEANGLARDYGLSVCVAP